MAMVLADAGTDVVLWSRRSEQAQAIAQSHRNDRYLPGIDLPASIGSTSDHREALDGAELVFCGVPSQTLRVNLSEWRDAIGSDATLLSLAKGVETSTLLRMTEVIAEVAGADPARVGVLSGPNLAREIAQRQPAATVIACTDEDRAVAAQGACSAPYFRPYTNTDVIGCEIGGAGKNVIALACGIAAGAGFGENTLATIVTRGLAEVTRLAVGLGGRADTLAGLAGVGDLVATCSSPLSRNRSFGFALGEGRSIDEAQAATGGQVAEGVKSCTSVKALAARAGVDMPLTEAVNAVCHEGATVAEAIASLLGRRTTAEDRH